MTEHISRVIFPRESEITLAHIMKKNLARKYCIAVQHKCDVHSRKQSRTHAVYCRCFSFSFHTRV